MATKEYTTGTGHKYEVRPSSGALASEAARNVKKIGMTTTDNAELYDKAAFSAELTRLVLVKWTKPDGTTPFEGLPPAKIREALLDEDGLKAAIIGCAVAFAKERGAEYEVDSGN
jgi:hypothetical protein